MRITSQKLPQIDLSQYQDHAAIIIDGDLDFDSQASQEGWLGNGSISSPYVIANMSFIQGIGNWGGLGAWVMILIQNTDYHFKIINNYLDTTELNDTWEFRIGIFLRNVQNSQVINNTIYSATGGVYIGQSTGCLVSNNTIVSNSYSGDPRADWPGQYTYVPGGRYPYGVGFIDSSDSNITHNSVSFNGVGIIVEQTENMIVTENTVTYTSYGIHVHGSQYASVIDNEVLQVSGHGLGLSSSEYSSFINNNIDGTDPGGIQGVFIERDTRYCIFENNTFFSAGLNFVNWATENYRYFTFRNNSINSLPLIYLVDIHDQIIVDAGLVYLVDCTNITISSSILKNLGNAMFIIFSENITIENNEITQNHTGITILDSENVTVSNNRIYQNGQFNVMILNSEYSKVISNTMHSVYFCISLRNSGSSEVTGNALSSTTVAIRVNASPESVVSDNEIIGAYQESIAIYDSPRSVVANNSIVYGNPTNNHGIYLFNSISCLIYSNIISSFWNVIHGIYLDQSQGAIIFDNHMTNSGLYFVIDETLLVNSPSSIDQQFPKIIDNNTVNQKPLIFLQNVQDEIIDSAGQIIIVDSINVGIRNSDVSLASFGLMVFFSFDISIEFSTFSDNREFGIAIFGSQEVLINNNEVEANGDSGIIIIDSENIEITNNDLDGNQNNGLMLILNSDVLIEYNSFSSNSNYGIYFDTSLSTDVSWNNFIDNSNAQVYSDDEPVFIYNYWNDWTHQPNSNNDCFFDVPYPIEGSLDNEDPYPLRESVEEGNLGSCQVLGQLMPELGASTDFFKEEQLLIGLITVSLALFVMLIRYSKLRKENYYLKRILKEPKPEDDLFPEEQLPEIELKR
jgi:parallel beta-helix repeat protein